MRIIFAGTPETAIPSLELLQQEHEVLAVLTRAPAPVGRKRIMTKSPVHEKAESLGLPVLTPATLTDMEVQHEISLLEPDAVAVVAYGLMIPKSLLDVPRYGWINLHFSRLPRWRGAAPVQFSIMAGDLEVATSVFLIEEGLDTGPIFSVEAHNRDLSATAGETLEFLSRAGAEQLSRTLLEIEAGTARPTKQSGEVTYAKQLTSAHSFVDFTGTAEEIANLILGTTPAPGPWANFEGSRIKLGPVRVLDSSELMPGEISGGTSVRVGSASQDLELSHVAPAGKKLMAASDWFRGVKTACPSFSKERL